MQAKVVKPFKGCPDGKTHPVWFERGDEVHGDLARVAVAEGWATSGKAPLENKADAPTDTKHGSASRPGRPSRKNKSTYAEDTGSA